MLIRSLTWALAASALVVSAAEPPATKAPVAQPTSPYLPAAQPQPTSSYVPAARAEPPSTPMPDANAKPTNSHLPRTPADSPATQEKLPPPQAVTTAPSATAEPPGATAPSGPNQPLTRRERDNLKLQECFLGYRSEFDALPLGYRVAEHFRTHVGNGTAARMVLYQFDFLPGSATPNLRGNDRLGQIADLLCRVPYPVVIERTPSDPALAEARRLAVLQALGQGPFPVSPERVVVGTPIANGLAGPEALRVYLNLLNQVEKAGGIKAGLDGLPLPGLGAAAAGAAAAGGPGQPPTIP